MLPEYAARFWPKVLKTQHCWLWAGTRAARGYGQFWLDGHARLAHRVAYELINGPIPDGMILLHSCDNHACVNPAHLRPGTTSENMIDMYRKGRGTYHPPKLTDRDRERIRRLYRHGGWTNDELARKFRVSERTIRRVRLEGTAHAS